MAAAIGANLDISGPNGHMIVDIGGGTTDIAVLTMSDVAVSSSIKVAGGSFDEAIARSRMYQPFEQHAREDACRLYQKEMS